jgi:LacI family transcriptional regulator
MSRKITLKEIATVFGVSISTVSKAINDSHEISEGLKEKIQQFAKENHYRPNSVALSLLKKSTKTIGVIVPSILNYFFTQVFYGIESTANKRGYNIISCTSNESYLKEVKTMEHFSSGNVDGVILSLSEETQAKNDIKHVLDFMDAKIPLVMFDRVSESIECDKVIVDDFEAGYKTTQYLFKTGCRKIAVVSTIFNSSVGRLRIDGYKKALKEENIEYDQRLNLEVKKDDDLGLLMSFLLANDGVDAIIALDEMTAVDVLNILKGKNIQVPEEISIVGFTNGQLSRYVSPPLTMVSQHGKYIGELTAEILIDRIEQNGTKVPSITTKLVKTSLILRESTISKT